MSTKEKQYWDSLAEKWKETGSQKLWRKHSDAVHTRFLSHWIQKTSVQRILKTDLFDEAFGEGLYPILVKYGKEVYGLDISYATLKIARSRCFSLLTTNADVRCLPFSNKTFDVVVSNSTLDHFKSKDEIFAGLREMERVLRSGGELILTLDNPLNPIVTLRNFFSSRLLKHQSILPYYVGVTCNLFQLKKFLKRLGLKVVHTGTLMHCPRIICVFLAGIFERYNFLRVQNNFLHLLMKFEYLAHFPTKYFTGYYITFKALKIKKQ